MVITDDPPEPGIERELLRRTRAGEAEAFALLIAPLQARLFRQAVALTNDVATAEDIVSETRIRAFRNFSRYNETCRLSTWLYAILLHCYQETVRRARSRPISLSRLPFLHAKELEQKQEDDVSLSPSPSAAAVQNETARELSRCVELLPEKHREVIQLRFFEDASLSDMAAVLGVSVGTVKSRLHHALEKLRKMKMNLGDLGGHQQL